jgi:hypothetical protein
LPVALSMQQSVDFAVMINQRIKAMITADGSPRPAHAIPS